MCIEEEVRRLALRVPGPPDEPLPAGTDDEAILQFEVRTGLHLPGSVRDWLRFTNGPCIGPGGLFGIRPKRESLGIEKVLGCRPGWRDNRWLPVAGDGCGNYYVVNTPEGESVYFIDACADIIHLAYSVASRFWTFLWFLFNSELGDRRWPFDKEYVVSKDPDVLKCVAAPLPWDA